jgi:uncharacterized Zn-binding protein involved in type VI secretion
MAASIAQVLGDPSTQLDGNILPQNSAGTVTIHGVPVAVVRALGEIHIHGDSVVPVHPTVGSSTVTAEGFPIHRVGDLRACALHQGGPSLKNVTVVVGP